MKPVIETQRPQVNRFLVALIAIGCLITGVTIAVVDTMDNFWCGSFVRVGLLMGAFWLAAPSKGRAAAWANVSPWWIVGVASMLIFIVRRPRVLIPFAIAFVVLGVIVPKLIGAPKR